MISVIIAVYNGGKHLAACLKSIINQSYSDLEIIIVNDGSTDNSLEIATKFKRTDSRITITDRPKSGLIASRIEGLRLSHGKHVYFMDADDLLKPDAIKELAIKATEHDSDVTIMGLDMMLPHTKIQIHAYTPSQRIEIPQSYPTGDYMIDCIFDINPLLTSVVNKLYKRTVCDFSDFKDPGLFLGEDSIINLQIFRNAKSMAYTDYAGYVYRLGGGSSAWETKRWDDFKKLITYLLGQIPAIAPHNPDRQKLLKKSCVNMLLHFLMENIRLRILFTLSGKSKAYRFLQEELRDRFWDEIRNYLASTNLYGFKEGTTACHICHNNIDAIIADASQRNKNGKLKKIIHKHLHYL